MNPIDKLRSVLTYVASRHAPLSLDGLTFCGAVSQEVETGSLSEQTRFAILKEGCLLGGGRVEREGGGGDHSGSEQVAPDSFAGSDCRDACGEGEDGEPGQDCERGRVGGCGGCCEYEADDSDHGDERGGAGGDSGEGSWHVFIVAESRCPRAASERPDG